MDGITKFLLDSGDPDEYLEIAKLAKEKGSELWGATTNPSLIAKKLTGQRISKNDALRLQKEIVMEILDIVPGAVSAEVYADEKTTAEEMITQGNDIATWHERVVVKLPTTLTGLKARTELRKNKIKINNTLVFSQQQIFAICKHEELIQKKYGPTEDLTPPFISPFLGRLDDIGEDGMQLVENGLKIRDLFIAKTPFAIWMLASSIRSAAHIKRIITAKSDIMTAPAKSYREWFALSFEEQKNFDSMSYAKTYKPIPYWTPPEELLAISSMEALMQVIETGKLDIIHPLTEKGIIRFAQDWNALFTS